MNTQKKTGYPSIDKPWMKWYEGCDLSYYPQQTLFDNIWNNNNGNWKATYSSCYGI